MTNRVPADNDVDGPSGSEGLDQLAEESSQLCTELCQHGLHPAPRLVRAVVYAAMHGQKVLQYRSGLGLGPDARLCMSQLADALAKCVGPTKLRGRQRLAAARQFLATWMEGAPAPHEACDSVEELEELEQAALEETEERQGCEWCRWRSSEEEAFVHGGSPGFLRALGELHARARGASGWMDESIWYLGAVESPSPRIPDAVGRRLGGVDNETIRFPSGVFREMSPSGMPDDPARIAPADLALLGGALGGSRALLAAKLAEDSLLVRFGAVQNQAITSPHVLVCIALHDTLDMHVHRPGQVVPVVEPLREALVRTLAMAVEQLHGVNALVEMMLLRSGQLGGGAWRYSDLKTAPVQLRNGFRQPAALVKELVRNAPWLFCDFPQRRQVESRPNPSQFDASFLLSFGEPVAHQLSDWTAAAIVRPVQLGRCELRFTGAVARKGIDLQLRDTALVARHVTECLGPEPEPHELSQRFSGSRVEPPEFLA